MKRAREPMLLLEGAVVIHVMNIPMLSFLKRQELSSVNSLAAQMLDVEPDPFWVFAELITRVGFHFCRDEAGILRRRHQMDVLNPSPFLNMYNLIY